MKIAVAGGTGIVGRHVVRLAEARGHEPVVLARSQGVDLMTGEGLQGRLAGVDAVVDATSVVTQNPRKARAFFGAVSRNLLAAEQEAGVGHHVAVSIVGCDEVTLGYYHGKVEQERVVTSGDVPWSLLRVTQFHEFALQILHASRVGPFCFVPDMLIQPVASVEVAEALVDLVEAGPSGRVPDLAGPERHRMVDLCRRVSEARGLGRRVVSVRIPGKAGRGIRSGALIPADGPRGRITFEEWLGASR